MIGKDVSHYRIVEKLGGGGMGVVYRAEDTVLDRHVALKFLPAERRATGRARPVPARGASGRGPESSHICTIHEIGEHEGEPFIVMELLEGQTLQDARRGRAARVGPPAGSGHPDRRRARGRARQGHRPPRHQAGQHLRDARGPGQDARLRAGEARRRGSTRRRPRSVGGGRPRCAASELTSPGSRSARSPTCRRSRRAGEPLDARSDLFSFGAVLYEMVTGRAGVRRQHRRRSSSRRSSTRRPVPVATIRPCPAELERIIGKALEKDPELRYQTAAELRVRPQAAQARPRFRSRLAARLGFRDGRTAPRRGPSLSSTSRT